MVEVIDNGCGISDVDCIVEFFSKSNSSPEESSPPVISSRQNQARCGRTGASSKIRTLAKRKGQYGVGLTTCLLYSQLHTHQALRYGYDINIRFSFLCFGGLYACPGLPPKHLTRHSAIA